MTSNSDAPALYVAACDVFDEKVQAVRPHQWFLPTPCADWDVRMLVNHVTVEDMWAPHVLGGATIEEIGDMFAGDQLGDDPIATWQGTAPVAQAVASQPDIASRTVHLSTGEDTAASYLMQMFADHLIHAWDLAAAIGADRRLPPDLVAACGAWFADTRPMYLSAGLIAEAPEVPRGADGQTRLLAAFGRRADWSPDGSPNGQPSG
jgi:uncharacterized protein (TIGR03086 family)